MFACALLASGQNSTLTGALAGQVVMEGFLGLKMRPATRQLLTRTLAIAPALAVILLVGERGLDRLLVLSQVVLGVQLNFVVLPLVWFTSDPRLMGSLANTLWVKVMGYALGAALLAANLTSSRVRWRREPARDRQRPLNAPTFDLAAGPPIHQARKQENRDRDVE